VPAALEHDEPGGLASCELDLDGRRKTALSILPAGCTCLGALRDDGGAGTPLSLEQISQPHATLMNWR
jgi:hypothetical protein